MLSVFKYRLLSFAPLAQSVPVTTSVTSNELGEASGPAAAATSSTVHDVEFDEHGQTWDVYGAEFDPEILGQAIQAHLEHMIDVRHQRSTIDCHSTNRAVTSRDDVITDFQSHAIVHEKRDVISRFFLRNKHGGTSTVNSWSISVILSDVPTSIKSWIKHSLYIDWQSNRLFYKSTSKFVQTYRVSKFWFIWKFWGGKCYLQFCN